jgi:hypothetical protein
MGFVHPEPMLRFGYPAGEPEQLKPMTVKDAYAQLFDMESAAQRYVADGKHADAARIRKSVAEMKKELDSFVESQRLKASSDGSASKRYRPRHLLFC